MTTTGMMTPIRIPVTEPCRYCDMKRSHPPLGEGQHVHPFELHCIDLYDCPYCGAKRGETCYDIRVHRKRKMQDASFVERERVRSAKRRRI